MSRDAAPLFHHSLVSGILHRQFLDCAYRFFNCSVADVECNVFSLIEPDGLEGNFVELGQGA
jgi:hypothetical protein